MSGDDLCYLTIADLAGLISAGKVSPVEVTEAHLRRIERIDGKLNTFLTVTAEVAREEARQAEREIATGNYRGHLHGVPYSLKDLYATAGIRTTGGTKIMADWVPDYDSAVAREIEVGRRGFSWGRPTCTSSQWAPRASTRTTAPLLTRGTWTM